MAKEVLRMTHRDIDRIKTLHLAIQKKITQEKAGEILELCRQQVNRLCQKIKKEGNRAVIHGLRGRPSNHQLSQKLIEKAKKKLKERYPDFGPTFAAEKLLEVEGIKLSSETVRRFMTELKLWKAKKRKATHRQWRERKDCFGEMVQMDGSDHAWFEGRSDKCILLASILSDTVAFKSVTTTEKDKQAAEDLAKIAGIEDMMELAMEMFKAKSDVAGKSPRDLLFRDYKDFDMNGRKVGIGQLELVDLSLVDNIRDDLYKALQEVKEEGGRHTVLLLLTDIMKEGSDVMVVSDDPAVVEKAYNVKIDGPAVWVDGMMSRKKQAVPPLQDAFNAA